jgi:hypothetical protein
MEYSDGAVVKFGVIVILKVDKVCRLYHKQIISLPLKFIVVSIDGFALLVKIFKFLGLSEYKS